MYIKPRNEAWIAILRYLMRATIYNWQYQIKMLTYKIAPQSFM